MCPHSSRAPTQPIPSRTHTDIRCCPSLACLRVAKHDHVCQWHTTTLVYWPSRRSEVCPSLVTLLARAKTKKTRSVYAAGAPPVPSAYSESDDSSSVAATGAGVAKVAATGAGVAKVAATGEGVAKVAATGEGVATVAATGAGVATVAAAAAGAGVATAAAKGAGVVTMGATGAGVSSVTLATRATGAGVTGAAEPYRRKKESWEKR